MKLRTIAAATALIGTIVLGGCGSAAQTTNQPAAHSKSEELVFSKRNPFKGETCLLFEGGLSKGNRRMRIDYYPAGRSYRFEMEPREKALDQQCGPEMTIVLTNMAVYVLPGRLVDSISGKSIKYEQINADELSARMEYYISRTKFGWEMEGGALSQKAPIFAVWTGYEAQIYSAGRETKMLAQHRMNSKIKKIEIDESAQRIYIWGENGLSVFDFKGEQTR